MKQSMFFPTGDENIEGIISKEKPIEYSEKKNIILNRELNENEYDEIYEFLRDQNRMSSGNFTLFPKDEITRFKRLNVFAILMRSEKNKSLIGTIFSVPFPIHCTLPFGNSENIVQYKGKTIAHGCTTFLNVHEKLRKHGLCMALIRELTQYGYEKNIFCSYFLTSFKLTDTSIAIKSWYRPFNLPHSLALGFGYPNWNVPSEYHNNRIKYSNKMSKKYICKRVTEKKAESCLNFYRQLVEDKIFVFMPDLEYFQKWIQEFPTFLVFKDKIAVGIFSISSIYCRMENGIDGKLALPLIFNAVDEHKVKTMQCLISIAAEREFDLLYTHEIGDITEELLQSISAIQNSKESYFALYNNSMILKPTDICVPLF